MKEITGNLWEQPGWKVITTNGTVTNAGLAVMGRGIAKEAALRYPRLQKDLGGRIGVTGNHVYLFEYRSPEGPKDWETLVTLPVKHHWMDKASLRLIKDSLQELVTLVTALSPDCPVNLVRPGCGNGGLTWPVVRLFCEEVLSDRFTIVERRKL